MWTGPVIRCFRNIFCVFALLAATGQAKAESTTSGAPGPRVDACYSTSTQSYKGYIDPYWAAWPTGGSGGFIVASDPQFPRVTGADEEEQLDGAASEKRLRDVFALISGMRTSSKYVPVIINGDLTEFGHGSERRTSQSLYPLMNGSTGGPLFFPGLGNHDYVNNVNDCANNGCARDSICDLMTWVNEILPTAGIPKSVDFKKSEDLVRGSLSYSFTIGDLHFIELNDSPIHSSTFSTTVETPWDQATFRIEPSLRWLEGDLREARRAGKVIFVNMHKRDAWPNNASNARFVELMQGYAVTAVFAGHLHRQLGYYPTPERFGNVPAFQSGGLLDGSFLYVTYDTGLGTAKIMGYKRGQGYGEPTEVPLKRGTWVPPVKSFSDAEITFYEGNNSNQKVVCDVMLAGNPKFNMNGAYGCSNDEARSLVIHKAKAGTMITLYGNYNHNGNESYAVIDVLQDITLPMTDNTFNHTWSGPLWKITKYGPNNLDGKISSVSVGTRDYNSGWMTLYSGNNGGGDIVCTEPVNRIRKFNMGGRCKNDEARSVRFHMVRAGFQACFYGDWDQYEGQGWSCMGTYRNYEDLLVDSFNYPVDIPGQYWVWRYKTIDGKVSSAEISALSRRGAKGPGKLPRRRVSGDRARPGDDHP